MTMAFRSLNPLCALLACPLCFACCVFARRKERPDRKASAPDRFVEAGISFVCAALCAATPFGSGTETKCYACFALAVLCALLYGASLSDVRSRTVPDRYPFGVFCCGLVLGCASGSPLWIRLSGGVSAFLVLFLVNRLNKSKTIGGADLKLTAALVCAFGIPAGTLGLALSLLAAVPTETVRKRIGRRRIPKNANICSLPTGTEEGFPLVPYLTGGFLASALLCALF